MSRLRIAVATGLMLLAGGAVAAETQWRFDGSVSYVSSSWSSFASVGAPVRGLFVLDRSVPYVQTNDPCQGSAIRTFYDVRAMQFGLPGASGAATTGVAPGVDCQPNGYCDVAVTVVNNVDPPACQTEVLEVDFETSPLASPQLGPVSLFLYLVPYLLPPGFYASIPDSPWPIGAGTSAAITSTQGSIGIAVDSLTRAQVCGDINLDMDVNATDLALLRAALANPVGAPLPAGGALRCSVIGGATDCDVVDVAVLKRALVPGPPALPPGVQQVCAAMNGG